MNLLVYRDENGEVHRPWQEGPAIIWPDGAQAFFEHSELHRPVSDGPALVDGDSHEYWEHGVRLWTVKE